MKLTFESNLGYQQDAIRAVVDLFEGNLQEVNGYVKVNGTLYEVHSFEDLRRLLELKK